MNGVGTLLYIFLTKGKIPSYLGSSFAFISPVLLIMATHPYSDAQSGFIVFGLLFVLFSFIVKMMGTKWIDFIFPPAAMGAIVSIIGLELAPTAASMAGLVGDKIEMNNVMVSVFTLLVTVIGSVAFKGFMAIIPILFGVVCGYVLAFFLGMVDMTPVINAPWFAVPQFSTPTFNLDAIAIIAPAALVVLTEHIGHLMVTRNPVWTVPCSRTAAPIFCPVCSVRRRIRPTVKISASWQSPKSTASGSSEVRRYLPSCYPLSAS